MGFNGAFSSGNTFNQKESPKQKASKEEVKKAMEKMQLPGHLQQGPPIQTTGANG